MIDEFTLSVGFTSALLDIVETVVMSGSILGTEQLSPYLDT